MATVLQPTTFKAGSIPDGDAGTRAMIASMQRNVARDYVKPIVRLTAVDIVRWLTVRDDAAQCQAIRDWMRDHVHFLRDPKGAELNHSPEWMLKQIQAQGITNVDCDDAAVLSAALGKSIGLRARFVCVAFHSRRAGFAHVWTDLASPIKAKPVWLDMDVTRAQAAPIPNSVISRRMEAEV